MSQSRALADVLRAQRFPFRLALIGVVLVFTTCASAGTAASRARFQCQRRLAAYGIPTAAYEPQEDLDHAQHRLFPFAARSARWFTTLSDTTRHRVVRDGRYRLVLRTAGRLHPLVERADFAVLSRRRLQRMQSRRRVPLRVVPLVRKIAERARDCSRGSVPSESLPGRGNSQIRVIVRTFTSRFQSGKDQQEPDQNDIGRTSSATRGGPEPSLTQGHNVPNLGGPDRRIELEINCYGPPACQEVGGRCWVGRGQ